MGSPLSFRSSAPLAALGLAGCQFVSGLGNLETAPGSEGGGGGGGPGATTTATASHTTTGTAATGATTTAATTTAATTGTETTTGAGGGGELEPCGNVTDTFTTLGAAWTPYLATLAGGELRMTVGFGTEDPYMRLSAPGSYSGCYATVAVKDMDLDTTTSIEVIDVGPPAQRATLTYDDQSSHIRIENAGVDMALNERPNKLGIAINAGSVHFLYVAHNGSAWTVLGSVSRPSWMDDGPNDTIGFGMSGYVDDQARFDDFNVTPIQLSDLP